MNLLRTVYLAGGMRGERAWQDVVMEAAPRALYIDPRRSRLSEEADYTAWDLTGVEHCDILFACMTKDNPSGYGLCVEVGVAAALGKHIVYVEEDGLAQARYLGMVRAMSNGRASTLEGGIRVLQSLLA